MYVFQHKRDYMKIIYGNLWELPSDFKVITTNGILKSNGAAVMGKGIALQALKKYPGIDFELGKLIKRFGNHVFRLSNNLISFPTKHDWKEKSDLNLIKRSAEELAFMLKHQHDITVLLPPPGCGNGGLEWKNVESVISKILDDKFAVVMYQEKNNY